MSFLAAAFSSPPASITVFLLRLAATLRLWADEADEDSRRLREEKYDPAQPRVPAGRPTGGEWTRTGTQGGGISAPRPPRKPLVIAPRPSRKPFRPLTREELARFNRNAPAGTPPELLEIDPRFGVPRWYVMGAVKPAVSPLDAIGGGGAARVAASLGKATATEAQAVARVLKGRITGEIVIENRITRIRRAADSVEEFLGGRPDKTVFKEGGDMVLMKGDKKFRTDIYNTGTKPGSSGDRVKELPHFHLRELKNGKWRDAGDEHRYYFKKDDVQ